MLFLLIRVYLKTNIIALIRLQSKKFRCHLSFKMFFKMSQNFSKLMPLLNIKEQKKLSKKNLLTIVVVELLSLEEVKENIKNMEM